jgi:hypothetical protein
MRAMVAQVDRSVKRRIEGGCGWGEDGASALSLIVERLYKMTAKKVYSSDITTGKNKEGATNSVFRRSVFFRLRIPFPM